MFLFCKAILYSGNCRIFRDLAFGSTKTRFKAILKKLFFRPRSTFRPIFTFFINFCPRRATFLPKFTFLMNFCPRRATFQPTFMFLNELLPPEGDFSAHIYVFKWTFAPGGRLFGPNLFTLFMNFCPWRATFLPKSYFLMNFCPRRATKWRNV